MVYIPLIHIPFIHIPLIHIPFIHIPLIHKHHPPPTVIILFNQLQQVERIQELNQAAHPMQEQNRH
jgi:hypothetical protein